ncbi:putative Cation/H+ exchanger 4 [Hibiscus syriacus]|uniref:Cation/H+ exchanger 4 n=2 Tax=Hibiscus syriacus TaxID=106335 RepID=A0A6A3AB19_HIBSY|nr:putative Cation/H+ exchanger 4 [Hibiscus syriacus]
MKTEKVEICLKYPPKINAPGLMTLLYKGKLRSIMDYSAPTLELQMILTYLLTQAIHFVLKRLRMPTFISQILAGIILGPTVFDDDETLITTSADSVLILGTVAGFGYYLYLFLTGVKMDFSMTYRSGKKALCIGILTVMVPFIVSLVMAGSYRDEIVLENTNEISVLAVAYSGTSFPVIHSLLSELKLLNSELGRLSLSSALVGNMLSLFLLNVCQGLNTARKKGVDWAILHYGRVVTFVVVLVFCFRPVMKWLARKTVGGGMINGVCLYAAILAFMVSHKFTTSLRIFPNFGPFLIGLAIPDGPPLGSALVEKLEPVVSGFLVPLFASTCGMRIDFSYLHTHTHGSFVKRQSRSAVVALLSKFGVSFLLSLLNKMPTRDALAFAFITISKGLVDMAILTNMHDSNLITKPIFVSMSLIVIVVASIVPIIVKALYDPWRKYATYHKRSIMHCKHNEELRMVSCIHVPANVNSIIDILSTSTTESPIALHVLHLIKLSGRATPLFISHDMNQHTLSNNSYSENVVLSFQRFERDNWRAVTVKAFTAVSPANMMHEDICNLALEHHKSFIVLPFHRRWHFDGSIESEDQTIRSLNYGMLEKAPCSVGILVEGRRHLNRSNSQSHSFDSAPLYNVAVIFLGGKDDQEALALGIRMSENENVQLTVIHLTAGNRIHLADDIETMQDKIMLRNVKECCSYIINIEKQVNDGPETLDFLRSIVDNYQLFIVGRRYNCEDPQTTGLHEWTEFEEIGIIGDLLSSADFGGNNSVLVLQKQPWVDDD